MAIFSYISGVAGTVLTPEERALFTERPPWGAILFARNIDTPDQVRALVSDIRAVLGRGNAPVLIDQEGGRVQRLRPPHWPEYPSASVFADLFEDDADAGRRAAWTGARLIGEDLHELGINVDCLPVADISFRMLCGPGSALPCHHSATVLGCHPWSFAKREYPL